MLSVNNLTKRFSGIAAVDGITFCIEAGVVTGCLGQNGSGKSTTMKLITGLLEPTSGEVMLEGLSIYKNLPAFRRRLGFVPEEPHLYAHLTGLEYLEMVAQLRELPERGTLDRIEELLRLLALADDRHAAISSYSKGMRQKILLAAALLHNPDVILLDEPFSGLDIGISLVLRSLIKQLARRGKAVLFSSHELDVVEKVADRVVILHRGKVVANDTISGLRALMSEPSLEIIFSQLAAGIDVEVTANAIAEVVVQA